MTLKLRIEHLSSQHRPRLGARRDEQVIAMIAERLERYAPARAGAVYPDAYARLHAALDRCAAVGIGIVRGLGTSLATRIAAFGGMTLDEYRAMLRGRAG